MIRAQSRILGGSSIPYCATATLADGSTWTTPPLVSSQAYTIRDVFQTPGGSTWSIRLNVQPQIVPTTLKVRIDGGIHATTRGAHPAQNYLQASSWTVVPGANPWTFELVGSTYLAGCVFGYGHCYVPGTLVEASVELNKMFAWIRTHGPAEVRYPLGGIYVGYDQLWLPENCSYIGHGGKNTFFFLADRADQITNRGNYFNHLMRSGGGTFPAGYNYFNAAEFYCEGFTLYGNRGFQTYLAGQHALDLGGGTDIPLSVQFKDVHVVGSAGYGCSLGGDNSKVGCSFIECTFRWSDGDNFDVKNRLSTDDDIHWTDCKWGWHAMRDQGTELNPIKAIASNGIKTKAGTTYVSIAKSIKSSESFSAGEIGTIAGAATFDGVDPNGSWHCLSTDPDDSARFLLDIGQTPSVGGVSGGGSAATLVQPHMSPGDCIVDMRGIRHSVRGGTWEGEMYSRNGFRQRGGNSGAGNGVGATNCTIEGVKGIDYTPAWVATTGGEGRGFVTLLGIGAQVSDVNFETSASVGISIGATASEANISDFKLEGCTIGVIARGENCQIHDGRIKNATLKAVEIWGASTAAEILLDLDPFVAAIGTAVVTVTQIAHGKTTGANVTFSGVIQGNGVVIRPSNTPPAYTLTVVDADHYTIVATGAALTADPWGGDHCQANFDGGDHDAVSNEIFNVRATQSDGSNTAVAFSIGRSEDQASGQATGTIIHGCSQTGYSRAYEDSGNGTKWLGFNRGGLPNQMEADTIDLPKTDTSCWVQHGPDHTLPVGESNYTIGNLGKCREIMVDVAAASHASGSTQNLQLAFSTDGGATFKNADFDYERIGASAGTSAIVWCGSVAAATPVSGLVTVDNFNVARRSFFEVAGGADGAVSGLQSAAGFMAAEQAYSALKLSVTGGFAGGVARVFRRD